MTRSFGVQSISILPYQIELLRCSIPRIDPSSLPPIVSLVQETSAKSQSSPDMSLALVQLSAGNGGTEYGSTSNEATRTRSVARNEG